jgi:hypothetical protein
MKQPDTSRLCKTGSADFRTIAYTREYIQLRISGERNQVPSGYPSCKPYIGPCSCVRYETSLSRRYVAWPFSSTNFAPRYRMEATKNAMQQQLSYQYSVSPQVFNAMIGEAQEDPRPCLKTCQVYPCHGPGSRCICLSCLLPIYCKDRKENEC